MAREMEAEHGTHAGKAQPWRNLAAAVRTRFTPHELLPAGGVGGVEDAMPRIVPVAPRPKATKSGSRHLLGPKRLSIIALP